MNWTEKWAKCHRHFPHADTDTNMYLERYAYYEHNSTFSMGTLCIIAFTTN